MKKPGNQDPKKNPGKMTTLDIIYQLRTQKAEANRAEKLAKEARDELVKIEADEDSDHYLVIRKQTLRNRARVDMKRSIRHLKRVNKLLGELAARREAEKGDQDGEG